MFSSFCPFPIIFIIFIKNKIYHLRVGIGIHHWWKIDIGFSWLEGPLHDHTLQWVNNVPISSSRLTNETFRPNSLLEERESKREREQSKMTEQFKGVERYTERKMGTETADTQ